MSEEAIRQVRDAIGQHGLWKGRFAHAIREATSDFTPDEIRVDDRCTFGRWLKLEVEPELRSADEYAHVVALHAEFHRVAANVVEEALRGGADVERLLGASSAYAKATAALTSAMMAWERKLSRVR